MYNLYLKYPLSKLDVSENDADFIDTMGIILKDEPETRFLIKKDDTGQGEQSRSINGLMQYISFVEECKMRNQEKPIQKRLSK